MHLHTELFLDDKTGFYCAVWSLDAAGGSLTTHEVDPILALAKLNRTLKRELKKSQTQDEPDKRGKRALRRAKDEGKL